MSWVIQTNESIVSQTRAQTENYKDKITIYHITCSIILRELEYIKNEDFIKIELAKKIMCE